jgi:hypothetical protein
MVIAGHGQVLTFHESTPAEGDAMIVRGEYVCQQAHAARALAAIKNLRFDEPLLGILTSDEQNWLTMAFCNLKAIDEQRAKGRAGDNAAQ